MVNSERLSVRQAAPVLGVSVHTVRAWVRQCRLPFFRLGRKIVFDRRDLDAFLRASRVPAAVPKRDESGLGQRS